jgi:hypothetical protein
MATSARWATVMQIYGAIWLVRVGVARAYRRYRVGKRDCGDADVTGRGCIKGVVHGRRDTEDLFAVKEPSSRRERELRGETDGVEVTDERIYDACFRRDPMSPTHYRASFICIPLHVAPRKFRWPTTYCFDHDLHL